MIKIDKDNIVHVGVDNDNSMSVKLYRQAKRNLQNNGYKLIHGFGGPTSSVFVFMKNGGYKN